MDKENSIVVPDTERSEFDILLGGDIALPLNVPLKDYVDARINEIEALTEAIDNPQRTAMIFQQLPKKMRRRVMSHNVKRMPNRLKQAHSQVLEKCGAGEVGKRPSRKYRRRPKNLREDYARRQRNNIWLETHIWHAKRFHMVNIWGYRLANFPNDKSFRACYRASSQHCLLQDISFLCCIELSGSSDDIVNGLSSLTDDNVKRKPQFSGSREGSALMKHADNKPIGEVTYIWRSCEPEEDSRQIWIWCHPAFYNELYGQIEAVFKSTLVTIKSLKDELVRFRLTGPKSIEVISSGLKSVKGEELTGWSHHYYSSGTKTQDLNRQVDYYLKFCLTSSPGQLPPRSILPALVTTSMPTLPGSMRSRVVDVDLTLEKPVESLDSPLWYSDVRQSMKQANEDAKESSRKVNKLIPSLEKNEIDKTPVAVLLVHREGRQTDHRGYGAGIDVICPAGWGMRIWLCLVHNGGRVCGLRESTLVETDTSLKPTFVLNSEANVENELAKNQQSMEKHFRLPPAKRTNFQKLGVPNPFDLPWDLLKQEWNSSQLIRISLISSGKLCPSAMICLPIDNDFTDIHNPPFEPFHPDSTKSIRNEIVKQHKLKLKKLAKQRKKLRLTKTPENELPSSKELVESHKLKMETLWLGELKSVRNHCSREIIGFLTDGSFSYLLGKCAGYGYITKSAFEILNGSQNGKKDILVLTRTTNSIHYNFAKINFVEETNL